MEYLLGSTIAFLWLSIGFGTRALFRKANHWAGEETAAPLMWPILLLISAYNQNWLEK